ncbi:MAG: DEAD/DEAH box helicase family protein [Candidatus Heimdallarchaeaceae archaeon]
MWHQFVSLFYTLGENLNRVSYLHGVGTGKTITALLTTQIWECKKILVVCPSSAFGPWEKDIIQATDYSYAFIDGSKEQKFNIIEQDVNISIIRYEALKTIYAELKKVKGNKRQWLINNFSFVHNFDCIIFDEVHKCKNYNALQSEICFELARRASFCIGLTGTPFDKTLLELFNIYKVIDLGDSLGTNFFAYRYNYFDRELRRGRGGRTYAEWIIKPQAKKQILDRLSGHTISFDREECFDLPETQTIGRPIRPSKEFLKLQENIINGDTIEINGKKIDCSTIPAKSQKLLQLSSGFLYYEENKERKVFHLKENPKLDALIDLIEDTESKVIVVHKFIEEALLIETAFKKNKIEFVAIRGSIKTDRKKEIQKFTENPDVKVMLIHPTCASEGFDGSISNVLVFFSPIASPKIREQCEGRIYRKKQNRKCVFFDLVLEQSVDSTISKNRAERKGLIDSVMAYIQEYQSKKS